MIELSISQELRQLEPSNKEQIAQKRLTNKIMLISKNFYIDMWTVFAAPHTYNIIAEFVTLPSILSDIVFTLQRHATVVSMNL